MAGVPPCGGIGAPFKHRGSKRRGNAGLVVRVVGLGGDFVVGVALRSDFNGDGRAGHAVDAGQRMRPEGDVDAGMRESRVDRAGESETARDPCGLGGLPRDKARGCAGASDDAKR